jgi:hypothetical protein
MEVDTNDPFILIAIELGLVQATFSDLPERLKQRETVLLNIAELLETQTEEFGTISREIVQSVRTIRSDLKREERFRQLSTKVPAVKSLILVGLLCFVAGVTLALGGKRFVVCAVNPVVCKEVKK